MTEQSRDYRRVSSTRDGADTSREKKRPRIVSVDLIRDTSQEQAMESEGMIALSAATTGVAAAGAMSAIRGAQAREARPYLIGIFVLIAGIASIPLVVAFAREFYVFYMPAVLVMLLALPPTIYCYVAARTTESARPSLHWQDGILPVAALMTTVGYWLLPATSKVAMFVEGELPPGFTPSALAFVTFALIFVWSLASFGYLVATLRRLGAFRARLKDLYSNTEKRELRWVDWLMALLVALWGATAMSLLSDNFGPGLVFPSEINFVFASGLLLFIIAFASFAPAAVENEPVAAPGPAPRGKYTRSALSEDHAKKLATRLEKAMREDRLYLDANLSLQKLSRHVGTSPNLVSQTLNEEIGSTFFDYVAHWRVEAAKPLVLSGEASILTIALDVGFNARSTFYKAFKRETGLTPKAFRDVKGADEK